MDKIYTTHREDGSTVTWAAFNKQVAVIDSDGIFRVTVDPTDENAALFIECIERVLKRRIAGIEASNG